MTVAKRSIQPPSQDPKDLCIDALIAVLEKLVSNSELSCISSLKDLQWAVEHKVILNTQQVCTLLEIGSLPPMTFFTRHGFLFNRVTKIGTQNGYQVTRRDE